jgi:hypothetical protein
MFRADDDDDDGDWRDDKILHAVAIAGLSALVTKLVDTPVDELRARFGRAKQPPEKPAEKA